MFPLGTRVIVEVIVVAVIIAVIFFFLSPQSSGAGEDSLTFNIGAFLGSLGQKVCSYNLRSVQAIQEVYLLEKGFYPRSMEELVPTYFNETPVCPGRGFFYIKAPGEVACCLPLEE